MRDLVPEEMMGRVFGERQKRMVGIGILASFSAAAIIDLWNSLVSLPETYAFGIVDILAFAGGMYAVIASRRIADVPQEPVHAHQSLIGRLREPLQNQNYQRLIAFLASWNFAVNLAAPFFTVHMIKHMELDLIVVIALATFSDSDQAWLIEAPFLLSKPVLCTQHGGGHQGHA
jgi:hypothetical protein